LERQARARHILGKVALDTGSKPKALSQFQAAHRLTAELKERSPNNLSRVYAHAQSEYFIGVFHINESDFKNAKIYWEKYDQAAEELYRVDPEKLDWIKEAGWGACNLGLVHMRLKEYKKSEIEYVKCVKLWDIAISKAPESVSLKVESANVHGGISDALFRQGDYEQALRSRQRQIELLREATVNEDKKKYSFRLTLAELRKLAILRFQNEDCDTAAFNMNLEKLWKFMEYDKQNYRWHHNYVTQSRDYLDFCGKYLSSTEISAALNILNESVIVFNMNEELAEKVNTIRSKWSTTRE